MCTVKTGMMEKKRKNFNQFRTTLDVVIAVNRSIAFFIKMYRTL